MAVCMNSIRKTNFAGLIGVLRQANVAASGFKMDPKFPSVNGIENSLAYAIWRIYK